MKPFTLTIFGASGDLSRRKLLPAVFNLYREKLLGEEFAIFGYARTEMEIDEFCSLTKASLVEFAGAKEGDEGLESFVEKVFYVHGGYDTGEDYEKLDAAIVEAEERLKCHGNRVYHIATPPAVFDSISALLAEKGMANCRVDGECSRVIIEKPFGHDYESAKELNRKLGSVFLERQIFRIDHYLGKETVQNILTLRFSNVLLESLWNNRSVDHVQITVAEEQGIGSRGSYYDKIGSCRDMMQNHLMQLLCITAMEPPNNIESNEVRDEKVKILKAIKPFDRDNFKTHAVRGQYGPSSDGECKPYRKEEGVPADSTTDTFCAVKLFIDNWRWVGVPFYLRTGKRMAKRYSEIYLQLRDVPKHVFRGQDEIAPEGILIRIQPDEGVSLFLKAKAPGPEMKLQSVSLDFDYSTTFHQRSADAYERLLYDAILDRPALFIRADETETAWKIFDPLFKHWQANPPSDFPNYFAGQNGCASADTMLERDGRKWRPAPEDI